MTNTKIKDMIETIEQFAQSQPDFPVYNILEVHCNITLANPKYVRAIKR